MMCLQDQILMKLFAINFGQIILRFMHLVGQKDNAILLFYEKISVLVVRFFVTSLFIKHKNYGKRN